MSRTDGDFKAKDDSGDSGKRPRSRLRQVLLMTLAAVVLLTGVAAWLLTSGATAGLRESWVRSALESSLGTNVDMRGTVDLKLGLDTEITFQDVTLKNEQWAANPELMRAQRGVVVIRALPLLMGRLVIRRLELQGANLVFDTLADGRSNWALDGAAGEAEAGGSSVLERLPILASVLVNDTVIVYRDRQTGWDFELQVDRLSAGLAPDSRQMTIDGQGKLNGEPLTVTGAADLVAQQEPADGPKAFEATLASEALKARVEGTLEAPGGSGARFALTGESASLGRLLEVFKVERALDGSGSVQAQFFQEGDRLAISQLNVGVTVEPGHIVNVEGKVGDVLQGSGLDISFTGKLAGSDEPAGEAATLQDIRLLGFSGKLAGSTDLIVLKSFKVTTNAIERELREIGSLSLTTVRRDDKGRISVDGIRAVSGDPENPALEINGSIGDLLRFGDVLLSGQFRFATTTLLGLSDDRAAPELGQFAGRFELAEKEGGLTISELSAAVAGTDLLDFKLSSAAEDQPKTGELSLDVDMRIPHFKEFGEAAGIALRDIGAVGFKGQIGGGASRLRAKGDATLGKTRVSGDFLGDFSGEKGVVTGRISSPVLHLQDVSALLSAGDSPEGQPPQAEAAPQAGEDAEQTTFTSKLLEGFDADLAIDVKKIAGSEDSASNIVGQVKLSKGVLAVKGLKAQYLGGGFRADGTIDMRDRPNKIKLKARVDHWPLGAVLKRIGSTALVVGDLYLAAQLTAAGDSQDTIVATLNGSFEAALAGGRIRSSQLALTGLDLTRWLISGQTVKGYSDVNCVIARFALNDGLATSEALIFDTPDVLLSGQGTIDLRQETLNIKVVPQPKRRRLVEIVTPFTVKGPLADPKVNVSATGAVARGVGEVLLLPSNALGTLVGIISSDDADAANPCLKQRSGSSQVQ